MANTTNIDLVKPAGTDHALVSVINANSDKIDGEAGNVRSNFALVQDTNTATQAISKDQLVVWKGVLKKATSNIANGATLSNSNLTDTKVSTELASLSDQIANIDTKINEFATVTDAHENVTVNANYRYVYKSGHVAITYFIITTSGLVPAWNALFKITNAAYTPAFQQHCCNHDGLHLYVNTDGTISTAENILSGKTVTIAIQYIAS